MRKIVFCLLLLFTGFCFAQGSGSVDLDIAISNSVREIKTNIPAASVVAVYNFDSPSDKLSKYIANAMIQNISNNTSMRVVERDSQNESLVEQNISYASSGNISDNSVYQNAKKLGAQFVIYGSFEQYGSLLQLTVRVTNVETGEIPVVNFSFVQKTKKIENLLGSSLVLESSSDYMEAIASCISKLETIKADNKAEINNVKSKISSEYQSQINEVKSRQKAAWLSQAEHQASISKDVKKIETERDTKISGETESINIKYSELLNNVENEINTLKKKLEVETFILRNNDVKLLFGTFDAESTPKHWKYSIESINENINYKYEGMYAPLATDIKTEYETVENVRNSTGFVGEIAYQVLASEVENSFDIKILNVKILYPDGSTLKTENINEIIGELSAANKNIVTTQNTTKSKQNVVKNEMKLKNISEHEATITKQDSKKTRSKKEKEPRVRDIFGFGYQGYFNQMFTQNGIYINALTSDWGCFYIDWINLAFCFGDETLMLYTADMGFYLTWGKFFPFLEAGIGISMFDHAGFLAKVTPGFEIKFSDKLKLITSYELYFDFGGMLTAYDGVKVGLSFGKPVKK